TTDLAITSAVHSGGDSAFFAEVTPHGSPADTAPAKLLCSACGPIARGAWRGPPAQPRSLAIRMSTQDTDPARDHRHGAALARRSGICRASERNDERDAADAALHILPKPSFHHDQLLCVDARRRGAGASAAAGKCAA